MRASLIRLLAASVLLFPSTALANLPTWNVIKGKSFLKFYAIQNGAPVQGAFKEYKADIRFDPDVLHKSSITVEVDTGSVTSANADVEQNLKTPDWLSAVKFPTATFKTESISRMPNSQNYYAPGNLTLRGKTAPVQLNFRMEHFDAKRAIATGYVTLHRNDFGVGQGEWAKDDVIRNEVRVEFRIVAEKQ